MTNEEAKEIFLNRGYVNGLFDGDKWRQSIVVISKWLEQKPCEDKIIDEHYWKGFNNGIRTEKFRESKKELCEDTINRQAVLDIDFKKIILTTAKPAETIEQKIKALPPVTPQPKIGHWIDGNDKCPCCGKSKFEGLDADIWADWQPKFCPNCGVKMESEDKEC